MAGRLLAASRRRGRGSACHVLWLAGLLSVLAAGMLPQTVEAAGEMALFPPISSSAVLNAPASSSSTCSSDYTAGDGTIYPCTASCLYGTNASQALSPGQLSPEAQVRRVENLIEKQGKERKKKLFIELLARTQRKKGKEREKGKGRESKSVRPKGKD